MQIIKKEQIKNYLLYNKFTSQLLFTYFIKSKSKHGNNQVSCLINILKWKFWEAHEMQLVCEIIFKANIEYIVFL